jgi:hypothetical protein
VSNTDPREASLAKPRAPQGPSDAEVLASFEYHVPSPEQALRIGSVRRAYRDAAAVVLAVCPPSADRTAALRQLHESMMTANKSIALEPGTPAEPIPAAP